MIAPGHIKDYCIEIDSENEFIELSELYSSEYSFVYQIACPCGCHKFHVYIDEHPTALAECSKCKNKFVLYDLSLYPNAIKLSKQFEMKKFTTINGLNVFELCVLYEYSDEFEFSDENFDVNDITGFSLFAFDDDIGKIITIFDDETA